MDSWDVSTLDVEVHKPAVLHSNPGAARLIAINLPAGEKLGEHQVHEHAYLVVTTGRLEIEHQGGTTDAGPGFVAHWEPHERHEVRALEDSRFVLLLAPWPGEGHYTENPS
jgi:quercetin dioxygenase-like cupin family protein